MFVCPENILSMVKEYPKMSIYDQITFDWQSNFPPNEETNQPHLLDEKTDETVKEEPPKKKVKLSRKKKAELENAEELRIQQVEEELLNLEHDPKSPVEFDRLLLGQPNNSELWIKYMSFHLQATEFEKARIVAHRALQIINTREEKERLNVWVALLHLENLYGTKESLKSCLDEALASNDPAKVYPKMLMTFLNSKKFEEAEELANKMCVKFKHEVGCWLSCAHMYFTSNQSEKARHLLQRACRHLSPKDYVNLSSRFALLECRYGFFDKAQTLFEDIVTTFPKRVDIWCSYTDMLIKQQKIDLARDVLKKACVQKLSARKMKSLFKRRLNIEREHGDENSVKIVVEEARKYIKDIFQTSCTNKR